MSVTLELPGRLLAKLKSISEARGSPLEEVILEAVYEYAELSDPEARVELHLKLCEKYLADAEKLLANRDYVQASEKLWGAASQIVKAVAAGRGLELRSHGELHGEIAKLTKETRDDEIRSLWQSAISLHQNFYENWLPQEMVEWNINDVKRLVEKLKSLIAPHN